MSACASVPKTSLIYVKLLKELTGIAKILNLCAEKSNKHTEYVPILCEALQICRYDEYVSMENDGAILVQMSTPCFVFLFSHDRLPFLKEKTSDELTYTQDVIEFLSHLGKMSSYY